MKKILLGVCLVFVFVSIKVSANEMLITIPNTISEDYITSKEYIHSSDVDFNSVGDGKITYYDKLNTGFKSKDVLVTDIESLKAGINIPIITEISVDETFDIQRIVNVSDGEFFVLGKIDQKRYPYESQMDKGFAYISYYQNNAHQWSKVLRETRYGLLVDGVITKEGIAVIGEYDSISQKSNVFISIITYNNEIVYDREIQGGLNDHARNIYYDNDSLIFCGVTESKDRDFAPYSETGFDIFIGNIHLPTNAMMMQLTGNRGNDNLISSTYHKGFLYLYAYFRGEGFFYNNNGISQDFKCIVEVDDRFEISIWKSIDELNGEMNEEIFIFDGKLVVSNFSYGDKTIHFRLYDLKLNFENFKSYTIPDVSRLKEYKIITNNDNLYITTLSIALNKLVNTTHNLDVNYLSKSDYSVVTSKVDNKILDFAYSNSKLKINIIDKLTNKIDHVDYTHIIINEKKIEYDKYYINDYDIIINGNVILKKLITNNVPINPFGLYSDLYSVKLDNIELVISIDKFYYDSINLKNKEVYDVGTILRFNGEGYLNDEVIKNNYKITEPGKFVLEIVGSRDVRKIINFSVTSLSLNPVIVEEYKDNNITLLKDNDRSNSKVEINLNNSMDEKIDNVSILIILSLASIGIVVGIFLPINFWRKKNV